MLEKFQFIADSDGNFLKGRQAGRENIKFVKCKDCSAVYSFQPSSGTSTLINHKCIDEYTHKPSRAQKDKISEAAPEMCLQDLRPYKLVDGDGFQKFIQAILDVQFNSDKRLPAQELVPHSTTVGRRVHSMAEDVK